jgi:hypothetical protein
MGRRSAAYVVDAMRVHLVALDARSLVATLDAWNARWADG